MDVLCLPLRSHGLWQSRLWPVGDVILSADGSQERECLVEAFVQHLSLGMKSLSAKASQECERLVNEVLSAEAQERDFFCREFARA